MCSENCLKMCVNIEEIMVQLSHAISTVVIQYVESNC